MTDVDAISRLESEERALASALAEFEHEARRVGDQLERQGGPTFALETRLKQLHQNVNATRRELERIRRQLKTLKPDPG